MAGYISKIDGKRNSGSSGLIEIKYGKQECTQKIWLLFNCILFTYQILIPFYVYLLSSVYCLLGDSLEAGLACSFTRFVYLLLVNISPSLCNQYYCTVVYTLIIHSNIFSWTIIEKTHLATQGLEPASPVSVNRHAICSRPSCIPK